MDSNDSSGYDGFLRYRAVILRAIGRAWADPDFRRELQADPIGALKTTFDYDFPYALELSVLDSSARWTPAYNGGWTNLSQNQVNLILPPCPEPGQQAVALAEYNASNLTFLTTLPLEPA
jgi:ribosomally synthesized peptide (two-chain TOMM family)